jgi:hypothetical protein
MTFIGLMSWKKKWCNNKNLCKQKQQQTLEVAKSYETLKILKNEFDKWNMVKLEWHNVMMQMKMEKLQV